MPTYVVEIEWPLCGADVSASFTPVVLIRDEDDTGPSPPAVDHQVTFTLFFTPNGGSGGAGEVQKSQQLSIVFDPAGEPSVSPASPLTTDTFGLHRITAELKKTDGTSVNTDEEIEINVTPAGRSTRDIQMFSMEE